jgi:hypothetical protein
MRGVFREPPQIHGLCLLGYWNEGTIVVSMSSHWARNGHDENASYAWRCRNRTRCKENYSTMEESRIAEGGRSGPAERLTRTMGEGPQSPLSRNTNLMGITKLVARRCWCVRRSCFFSLMWTSKSPHLQLMYRWTKHRQCPTHAVLSTSGKPCFYFLYFFVLFLTFLQESRKRNPLYFLNYFPARK